MAGLRFVLSRSDLSIVPSHVGSNTASVALLIGEKCARFLSKDLQAAGNGLKTVEAEVEQLRI